MSDAVPLRRSDILPERLGGREALARGRDLAKRVTLKPSSWLRAKGVGNELAFKRQAMAERRFTFHAQIGYRDAEASRRAWAEIFEALERTGTAPDRYGICLDWSMGYPATERRGRPRGTGLILDRPEDFAALTGMAPVAPHFGDFVLGMPAAVENTAAALRAGSTTIGNLAQYFTFRLPGWSDDVGTTLATVEALGLLQGQSVPILVHSNLDDGYAAWFEDMSSALGFAMIERWLIEDVLGLPLGHCFGHTFTDPTKRLAFQIALARANPTPGTMLYGNTTLYGPEPVGNYGALASYILVDAFALWTNPSGQALTPIPVTEARRIPAAREIVDAHRAARRLVERMADLAPLMSTAAAEPMAETLLRRGTAFKTRVLEGLDRAGVDLADPAEVLLALRRIGPAALERRFGAPREPDAVTSPFVDEIDALARTILAAIGPAERAALARRNHVVVLGTTDVHFYGKRLLGLVLGALGVSVVDAGVSVDPHVLAEHAKAHGAGVVAVSTYNGVALSFVQRLRAEFAARGIAPRLFVGGRLNEILDDTAHSMPVDVSAEMRQAGAVPCASVEEMIAALAGSPRGGET